MALATLETVATVLQLLGKVDESTVARIGTVTSLAKVTTLARVAKVAIRAFFGTVH